MAPSFVRGSGFSDLEELASASDLEADIVPDFWWLLLILMYDLIAQRVVRYVDADICMDDDV